MAFVPLPQFDRGGQKITRVTDDDANATLANILECLATIKMQLSLVTGLDTNEKSDTHNN